MTEKFDFTLNKKDFAESDWKETIEEAEPKVLEFYSLKLAQKARNENDERKAVLELLAVASMSHLNTDKTHDPISNADQLSDEDLSFLLDIVAEVNNNELQARIADILWIRKRNYKMAELAVSSYLASSKELENFEHWSYAVNRIERALQLAAMLGNKELYQSALDRTFNFLDKCNGEDPNYLSAELMRLLQERREGDPQKYAQFCEKLALTAEKQNDFHKARRYWEIKVDWHLQDKDENAARDVRLKIAESFEKESDFSLETRQPKYLMASDPLERAIIAYRNVGNSSKKIEEIKLKLRDYQSKAVKELPLISSGSYDITDLFIHSENAVKDKSFVDSLRILALLSQPNPVKHIRQQVEENRKKYLGLMFFPKKLFSTNGRIIGVQPSGGEEAILVDMFQYITDKYQIRVKGIIEPARNIILLEHPARVFEIYDLMMNHPFIPEGREFIVARGLHAGLTGDFLMAIHFLIPQIEESLRYFLIRCGIVPSSFTDKGIQDEYNLNKLLKDEKFTSKLNETFGEDFIFDLRCVLVERFGANLRNDTAHGLIDHYMFYSFAAIYFWWLCLRFYLLPVFLKLENEKESTTTQT